jgi:hypothetical protein
MNDVEAGFRSLTRIDRYVRMCDRDAEIGWF